MNLRDALIPKSMLFQWHITDRCNLRCSHCYQDATPAPDPSRERLMSIFNEFRSFAAACRDPARGRAFRAHVTVTGGEPFLNDDFLPLLEKVSSAEEFSSFAVLTNGTLLTPEVVACLGRLRPSFVQVSIDGSRETHDRIRGEGSHARAVSGIKLLVRAGIPAYLSFTAQRGNYRDFPAVARLGKKVGAARVWSDRMIPCDGKHKTDETLLTPEQTREFIGIMERERHEGWFAASPVVLHRALQFTATGAAPYRCTAGDTLLTVLPNGDVYPCRRLPLVAGNLFRQPLLSIYRDSELLRALRDRSRIAAGCANCFYAHTCGGGSRCLAHAVHGDPFRADPGCWLVAGAVPSSLLQEVSHP